MERFFKGTATVSIFDMVNDVVMVEDIVVDAVVVADNVNVFVPVVIDEEFHFSKFKG